jgi:DNA primase
VSVPITWDELDSDLRSDTFDVKNIEQRLETLAEDPWSEFESARAPIPTP